MNNLTLAQWAIEDDDSMKSARNQLIENDAAFGPLIDRITELEKAVQEFEEREDDIRARAEDAMYEAVLTPLTDRIRQCRSTAARETLIYDLPFILRG